MEQGTYGGRFVHIRGDQLDLMRVVHRRVDGRRVELMVSENGEIREIRRVGDRCACVWPERDQVMLGDYPNINGRLSGERFESADRLAENYRLIDLGDSRVASQACHLIAVVPRDDLRFGYKLCIGKSTPLLLRMSIYDESGSPIEHNQFTKIEPIESARLTFQDDLTAGLEEGYEQVEIDGEPVEQPPIRQQRWTISALPVGYEVRSRSWRRNPVTGQYFEHIVVSDGLATASVFIEKRDTDATHQVTQPDQGMAVAARSVDAVSVTAIGDVPAATVEYLVEHTVPDPTESTGDSAGRQEAAVK
ncbi:MAG: MucB/RseB C-terminal domain-containing protein [Halothiobacillaceae bacterium]|nr:MucB/RseB C-terminal domain-containing protein [Halothiobacillaceae bacterium]